MYSKPVLSSQMWYRSSSLGLAGLVSAGLMGAVGVSLGVPEWVSGRDRREEEGGVYLRLGGKRDGCGVTGTVGSVEPIVCVSWVRVHASSGCCCSCEGLPCGAVRGSVGVLRDIRPPLGEHEICSGSEEVFAVWACFAFPSASRASLFLLRSSRALEKKPPDRFLDVPEPRSCFANSHPALNFFAEIYQITLTP